MPRQIYNSHVMYLFKKLPNVIESGLLKGTQHQEIGERFLCKVTEVVKQTGEVMIGNRMSEVSDFVITREQLNFEDGDLVGYEKKRTKYNASSISEVRSKPINGRGNRHRRNPLKEHKFIAG